MKYSELKKLRAELSEYGFDNWRQAIVISDNGEVDFTIDDFRFIDTCAIDNIQQDELASDPYILGLFNAWFIADNTDLNIEIVKALQDADKCEAIGNHIVNNGFLEKIQENYASADGYGHHFNPYDGSEIVVNIREREFYVFRLN